MMEFKVIGFILVALVLSVCLKEISKETGIILTVITASVMLLYFSLKIGALWQELIGFFDFDTESLFYCEIVLKILGIALITQEVSSFCIDAGEGTLGKNALLLGKITILFMCLPILKHAVEVIKNILVF